MGDSPRLFDVNVKVNYLGLKLKRRSERGPQRENGNIVSCTGGNYNAAIQRANAVFCMAILLLPVTGTPPITGVGKQCDEGW
jgi:hypothetical protein